jgi:murein L,D-transpeptidase YcbB/YkuD
VGCLCFALARIGEGILFKLQLLLSISFFWFYFFGACRRCRHRCIRIEKPFQLANFILPTPVDSSFLQSCLRDEQPIDLDIVNPVPVFVIYSTVSVDSNNKVVYYKEVYHLLKR